jgi:hypothetical protein
MAASFAGSNGAALLSAGGAPRYPDICISSIFGEYNGVGPPSAWGAVQHPHTKTRKHNGKKQERVANQRE